MTFKHTFIFLLISVSLSRCNKSGIDGYIINNSDDTLIINGLVVVDTLLLPHNNVTISNHPLQEWVSHKSICCPCELVRDDGFIKPLNKAKKLIKNIRSEIEWKKISADKNASLNCQFIIYQHDIIN